MRVPATTALLLAVTLGVAACGSGGSSATSTSPGPSSQTSSPATASSSGEPTSSAPSSALVGRWETNRTCQGMVAALHQAGLDVLAPWVVGDYFPDQKPAQLAAKADVCDGATPQRHSHFFTEAGAFGSVDQDGHQVDDGSYAVVDGHTLTMNDGQLTWHYAIAGDHLRLTPVIPPALRREALRHPGFDDAGYLVAVAYTGHDWTRVPCDGWC